MRKLAPLAIVVVLALVCVASANLLVNGDFTMSGGGGGSASNWWAYSGPGTPGDWAYVGVESWAGRVGTNGMVLKAWNGEGVYGGYGQDVATNLAVGDVVTFSIYGNAEPEFTSSTSEAWLKMEFWSGGSMSYNAQVSVYDALTANRDTWNLYTMGFTNNVTGIDAVKVLVGWGNNSTNGRTEPVAAALKWDDADMTIAIPEPTMAALLGFSGLIFLAARRMVRK